MAAPPLNKEKRMTSHTCDLIDVTVRPPENYGMVSLSVRMNYHKCVNTLHKSMS